MFFPLKDENPTTRPPIVTIGLMVICLLVFLLEKASGQQGMQQIIYQFGLIPSVLLGLNELPPNLDVIPAGATLITSMFLHGGWMHLIGNMWFLWIFGNNIEDELGHGRFLLFYLLSGLGAAALQIIIGPNSDIPMVGASGAISGVLGAYMLLYPKARILTLVFLGFFITMMRITAIWFLGIWFGMQLLYGLASAGGTGGGIAWWAYMLLYPRAKILTLVFLGFFITMIRITAIWFLGIWFGMQLLYGLASAGGTGGGIAWWAHIGGFLAGVGLLYIMRKKKVKAFGEPRRSAFRPPPDKSDDDNNIKRGPWG